MTKVSKKVVAIPQNKSVTILSLNSTRRFKRAADNLMKAVGLVQSDLFFPGKYGIPFQIG